MAHGMAQENTYQSVLSEHTWHRIAVTQEGVYKLDYATLQAMGIDMTTLNPNQIRIFGNPSGALPERNSEERPDDLTELAIDVEGSDDGVFDETDVVLFYGQEPTRLTLIDSGGKIYKREPNRFSDTTFYYLCVDSGTDGLRVGEQASLPVDGATAVISEFPDMVWHEAELMSPYFVGQNWFGEMITASDSSLTIPLVFPNLVKSKTLRVKYEVLGRIAKGKTMYYDSRVNDNVLANHAMIAGHGNNDFGLVSSFDRQVLIDSDTALFVLGMYPDEKASLYLDYVEISGWRQLIRMGDMFRFKLVPSQFGGDVTAVWVQNANARFRLWDVSAPLRPFMQNGVLSGGNLVFATDGAKEHRYVMFDPSAALPIEGWTRIANQNLHAIGDADMLILTSRIFWQQAQALADFHAEVDGLRSVVVDVQEIYNEFSTGTPDPTGIRDFVRMVYGRSAGNLKYLALFGRASADYRNIMGYGQNLVPCYESSDSAQSELTFCTDDYFGLMDDNEGVDSQGQVDIGIGRISVSTPEEAETVLRKIRHYHDLTSTYGIWKTDFLLVSDDENTNYVEHNEEHCRGLDTLCPAMTHKKVYCGAYLTESTSSGISNPGANFDLKRALEKGTSVMLYTGHGGDKGLTGEKVFTTNDIVALENYDKMPFVFTATCEFTKYDNPLHVSAGEHLFLNPRGGSVAMFTTCRPTFGHLNIRQARAFVKVLYSRDEEGRSLRFGDIVRLAKSDPLNFISPMKNENIRFMFMGDPALRFSVPMEDVAVLRINGKMIDGTDNIEIHAMSMVSVEGEIRAKDGSVDSAFNGELWVRFFDKKSKVKVMRYAANSPTSNTNVYYHKDVLYEGKASVTNGKFTIAFQVPQDIMLDSGAPRFSFYAYDAVRNIDAMGKFTDLTLGGTDPTVVADDEGPTIKFYWNTPDFENGQSVERQGVLYADLYDAQGIYHYEYSIGRDMVLSSNLAAYNSLVLNDRFEPTPNDYRRGRVSVPVSDLAPGTYEFGLRVWDTQNNASEASLWLVVDDDLFLSQVRNYPNPFSEETYITMTHLGDDGNFEVNIEVFDVLGRKVADLRQRVASSGGVIEPIRWNGCNASGSRLKSGIYLYRLTLTDEEGFSRTVSQRMVITR